MPFKSSYCCHYEFKEIDFPYASGKRNCIALVNNDISYIQMKFVNMYEEKKGNNG